VRRQLVKCGTTGQRGMQTNNEFPSTLRDHLIPQLSCEPEGNKPQSHPPDRSQQVAQDAPTSDKPSSGSRVVNGQAGAGVYVRAWPLPAGRAVTQLPSPACWGPSTSTTFWGWWRYGAHSQAKEVAGPGTAPPAGPIDFYLSLDKWSLARLSWPWHAFGFLAPVLLGLQSSWTLLRLALLILSSLFLCFLAWTLTIRYIYIYI
jgi:hypothetical protein